MKYFIWIVLWVAAGGVGAYFYMTNTVYISSDTKSAGWVDKVSDDAFTLYGRNCVIQWNAIHYKSGNKTVSVRVERCTLNFEQQLSRHRKILAKINQKWPLSSFDRLHWGSFCASNTKKWCRKIILGSRNAPQLLNFIKKYPRSGWKGPTELYLSVGKATPQYKALKSLLAEFGLKIGKLDVEKVEKARLNKVARLYDIAIIKPSHRPDHKYPWVVFGGSNLTLTLKPNASK